MVIAAEAGEDLEYMGVLVDEQFGGNIPEMAKKHGLKLAMPVEKSGQDMFDFEYGDDFGEHIERFDPDFSKVLVRYNPDYADTRGERRSCSAQDARRTGCTSNDRKFLFELLVPAEPDQLESVGGDTARYDAELRPDLMVRAIAEIQDAGVEADIWKIEGLDDARRLRPRRRADPRRRPRRRRVRAARPRRRQRQGRPLAVPGRPRSTASSASRSAAASGPTPLKAYLDGSLDRETAAAKVAENYTRFIEVWRQAE